VSPYRFERDLRDKLRQKSNTNMTEEACFVKMFKFFDVQAKGSVTFEEFARVLEKTGMYYPQQQMRQLFEGYDANQNGSLDYKELAFNLFREN
jgi:Ca2+-binding EF-hand superfamily protein